MNAELLRGNLELILLSILKDGPLYGLKIIEEAQDRTGGYFRFKEGSVYPALHRLTHAGLLSAEVRPSPRGGMPTRYYQLTEQGVKALAERRAEWAAFRTAVDQVWSPE